jgi:GT2 family glycosyltransferase
VKYSETISSFYINQELTALKSCGSVQKDILLVVKDQYKCVKNCIESILANTNCFNLYVWDNGSREQTATYLQNIDNIHLFRKECNEGFIKPNNYLASQGNSPYLILLNSDTIVKPLWDAALIGWLKTHPKVAQVGYMGMKMNADISYGYDIDFISAWCTCISRETYNQFGLFDEENLEFAYSEDADLSFRLQEAGHEIYALYLRLVDHLGNQTIKALIEEEGEEKFRITSEKNRKYLNQRWGKRYE